MSENQEPPWTFRIQPDVESAALDALNRLRWTKTQLVNEALRIALPIIVDRQIQNLTQGPVQRDVKQASIESAVSVAKSRKRAANPKP